MTRGIGIAGVVLAAWVLLAVTGPGAGLEPDRIALADILAAPGAEALLGRDDLGRDMVARVVVGARISLLVAVGVVAATALVGITIGMVAGWFGGMIDLLCMCVVEVFQAFPGLLLAIAFAAVLGPGLDNVVLALAIGGWIGFARLARAQTLALKSREHVAAAIGLGISTSVILVRHILPLLVAPLLVEATFALGAAIVGEAGLSFLGLGVPPPTASWGTMIRDGVAYMLVAPHMVIAPGVALVAVVLAVNVLGDRLRDRLDPRSAGH